MRLNVRSFVDSAMWWVILMRAHVATTGDWDYVKRETVQTCMREILELYLRERFEYTPTLLVPDGSFMIDRRMGVYGHRFGLDRRLAHGESKSPHAI